MNFDLLNEILGLEVYIQGGFCNLTNQITEKQCCGPTLTNCNNFPCSILQSDSNFPWSVLLTTIEMMSTCSKATSHRRWFYCKVLNILTSFDFLWPIRVQTMENCCWFVFFFFYHNIDSNCFDVYFHWNFLENLAPKKEKKDCNTITSFWWSVLLLNIALNQSPH